MDAHYVFSSHAIDKRDYTIVIFFDFPLGNENIFQYVDRHSKLLSPNDDYL